MSVALSQPMTLAAFLAWEERQESRFEYDGVGPVAMTGGTFAHEMIGQRVRETLNNRMRNGPCVALGPTLKIQVAGHIRYPDAFVICSQPARDTRVIHDPVVVFEVLSDSTARTDMVRKLNEYAATLSIQRYVMLQQNFIGGLNLERRGDQFVAHSLAEDSVLEMPEIGVAVPVAEFYQGLVYDPVEDEGG